MPICNFKKLERRIVGMSKRNFELKKILRKMDTLMLDIDTFTTSLVKDSLIAIVYEFGFGKGE